MGFLLYATSPDKQAGFTFLILCYVPKMVWNLKMEVHISAMQTTYRYARLYTYWGERCSPPGVISFPVSSATLHLWPNRSFSNGAFSLWAQIYCHPGEEQPALPWPSPLLLRSTIYGPPIHTDQLIRTLFPTLCVWQNKFGHQTERRS